MYGYPYILPTCRSPQDKSGAPNSEPLHQNGDHDHSLYSNSLFIDALTSSTGFRCLWDVPKCTTTRQPVLKNPCSTTRCAHITLLGALNQCLCCEMASGDACDISMSKGDISQAWFLESLLALHKHGTTIIVAPLTGRPAVAVEYDYCL